MLNFLRIHKDLNILHQFIRKLLFGILLKMQKVKCNIDLVLKLQHISNKKINARLNSIESK